jgi:hypothetical protein
MKVKIIIIIKEPGIKFIKMLKRVKLKRREIEVGREGKSKRR